MAGYSVAEFEIEGRTYRIQTDSAVTFSPHYFVNQMRDSVGSYTDLNTGEAILINWQRVGVVRVLEVKR